MASGEGGDWAGIDQDGACAQEPADVLGSKGGKLCGPRPIDCRALAVNLAQAQEVRRVAAEPIKQQLDESILAGRGQQRVGGPLGADGGGALGAGRCGAKRAGAVGGIDRQVVGQGQNPLV